MGLFSIIGKGFYLVFLIHVGLCDHLPTSFHGWKHITVLEGKEVIGTDLVAMDIENKQQCARMCWLYTSCTVFTFYPDKLRCRLTSISPPNLISNLAPKHDAITVDMRRAVVDKPRLHGCDHRRCQSHELCAPVEDPDSQRCLSLGYTKCRDPPPRINNSLPVMDGIMNVRFNCQEGYLKTGKQDTSTCSRQTGVWSDVDVSCTFLDCGEPPEINGAIHIGRDTSYSSKIQYICYDGWVSPSVDMTVTCQMNSEWTNPPQACSMVKCHKPISIENGNVIVADRRFTNADPDMNYPTVENGLSLMYGATAIHSCIEGFKANGDDFRSECQTDGTWQSTSQFVCKPIDCGRPSPVPNAWMKFNQTTFESQTLYECVTGYKNTTESMSLVCQSNGTWGGQIPTCQIVDCGIPKPEENSSIVYTTTTYKSTANYTCESPTFMYPEEVVSRNCQHDGQWSNESIMCVPCGKPKEFEHSVYNISKDHPLGYFIAEYSCQYNLTVVGEARHICDPTKNNTWIGNNVTCTSLPCGNPPMVLNTTIKTSADGLVSTYECPGGGILMGVCNDNGSWSLINTTCPVVKCGNPPHFTNVNKVNYSHAIESRVSMSDTTNLAVGSHITYICNHGYKGRDNQSYFILQCSDKGTWVNIQNQTPVDESSTNEGCLPVDCGPPPNISFASVVNTTTTYNSTIQYVCDTNYILSNTNGTMTCNANGEWSKEDFRCEVGGCGPPPKFENAIAKFNETKNKVYYSCEKGYRITNQFNYLVCVGIIWVGRLVSTPCSPIDCGSPDILDRATFNYSSTLYNNTVTYTCKDNYTPKGNNVKRCNESGLWSGDDSFICEELTCSNPPVVANATVNTTKPADSYSIGSFVTFVCNDNFLLLGANPNITCLENGSWSKVSFECMNISCGPSPLVENSYSSLIYNDDVIQAVYTCDTGYYSTKDTQPKLNCTSGNTWTAPLFKCLNNTCKNIPSVTNAKPHTTIRDTTVIVSYECNAGYQHWWFDLQTCHQSGRWSNNSVECVAIDCGDPPDVPNAVKRFKKTNFESEVSYSCNSKYRSTHLSRKRCLGNGKWSDDLVECTREQLICSAPPQEKYSTVKFTTLVAGEAVANYTCDAGYTVGMTTSFIKMCTGGVWSDSRRGCTPVSCPDNIPVVKHASLINTDVSFEYGYELLYECVEGFRMAGNGKKKCSSDGSWSPNIIECFSHTDSFCQEPPVVENTTTKVISYAGQAVYECLPGFLSTTWSISCNNGIWTATTHIKCTPRNCGQPIETKDAHVSVLSTYFGSKAVYKCKQKYIQKGPYHSVCQHNGQWSDPISTCVPDIACISFPDYPNTTSELDLNTPLPSLKFTCIPNHIVSLHKNTFIVVCLSDGSWTPSQSVCHPTGDCLSAPNITNAKIIHPLQLAIQSNSLHFAITYGCNIGYRFKFVNSYFIPKEPSVQISCVSSTGWNISFSCEIIDCGPHPKTESSSLLDNGDLPGDELASSNEFLSQDRLGSMIIDTNNADVTKDETDPLKKSVVEKVNGTTYESEAIIGCQSPFLGAKEVSVCQENGNWSDVNITCRQYFCDITPKLTSGNGYFSARSIIRESHQSSWVLICDEGYQYLGSDSRASCHLNTTSFEEVWDGLDEKHCVQSSWPAQVTPLMVQLHWDKREYFDSVTVCTKFNCSQTVVNTYGSLIGFRPGVILPPTLRIRVDRSSTSLRLERNVESGGKASYDRISSKAIDINQYVTPCFYIFNTNNTVITKLNGEYFGKIVSSEMSMSQFEERHNYIYISEVAGYIEFVSVQYSKLDNVSPVG